MREIKHNVSCRVDRSEALRYLGYADQALDPGIVARMEDMFALCEETARPSWCFDVFPVEMRDGEARLRNSALTLSIDGTLQPLARMEACAIMACTIGFAHDREERRLAIAQPTEALMFDAAGSSLVERCAASCERAIREQAFQSELHAGQRMSPGYGDFPLGFSHDIVRALDVGKRLGISVTDADLLAPLKSVTAIVGLFEREEDARRARRSCVECVAREGCSYLAAGNPCYI